MTGSIFYSESGTDQHPAGGETTVAVRLVVSFEKGSSVVCTGSYYWHGSGADGWSREEATVSGEASVDWRRNGGQSYDVSVRCPSTVGTRTEKLVGFPEATTPHLYAPSVIAFTATENESGSLNGSLSLPANEGVSDVVIETSWALERRQPCPSSKTRVPVFVDVTPIGAPVSRWPVNVHFELSGEEIEDIKGGATVARSAGLTRITKPVQMEFHSGFRKASDGQSLCYEVQKIVLRFGEIDLYVASEYPAGSCEHNATLAHEQRHAADYEALLEAAVPDLVSAVRAVPMPTPRNSLPVSSSSDPSTAQAQLDAGFQALLTSSIEPRVLQLHADLRSSVAALDTPEERTRVHAMCHDW